MALSKWRLEYWDRHKGNGRGFAGRIITEEDVVVYDGPFSFWSLIGEEEAELIVTAVNFYFDALLSVSEHVTSVEGESMWTP